jgi:uncharacterized protein (DUF2141 family)
MNEYSFILQLKIKMKLVTLIALIILGSPYQAERNQKIFITIKGLHNNKGKVYVSLYNSEDGYPTEPEKAFRKTSCMIHNNQCTLIFDNLPNGFYAIACYHDENDNGKFDFNFFHIPLEGSGASNNAIGVLGPPKFKDAKFYLNADINQLITISY